MYIFHHFHWYVLQHVLVIFHIRHLFQYHNEDKIHLDKRERINDDKICWEGENSKKKLPVSIEELVPSGIPKIWRSPVGVTTPNIKKSGVGLTTCLRRAFSSVPRYVCGILFCRQNATTKK